MKPVTRLLTIIAFLCLEQSIIGRTAQAASTALAVGQNHAPGSMVRFEHITVQNGLSQNTGQVIFQDRRGFLWIGTQDGLNRYDGYTFTVFRNDPEIATTISSNSILAIEEDKQGTLCTVNKNL